jgi:hypothetical protein
MIRISSLLRPIGLGLAMGGALAISSAQAQGQSKPAAKPAAPAAAAPSGPVLLETFGDWGAYASDTPKGRVCYALSKPKERLPKELKRDDGFLFITTRPSEGVRNEVSAVLGYPTKDNSVGEMTVGATKYALVTKGAAAWIKNAAEDPAAVEAMKKSPTMTVKASSARGNATTDKYSLNGLGKALDRLKKECP